MKAWWLDRKEELYALFAEKGPLYVYNDETLNDTFFDCCCLEGVDRIFYAVSANAHPRILEKIHKLGGGFTCISIHEIENLFNVLPQINPLNLFFVPDTDQAEDLRWAVEKGVPVILDKPETLRSRPDILKHKPLYISINSVSRTGPNIFMSEFKAWRPLLTTHPIKIKGIRLQWKGSGMSNKELAALTSLLSELSDLIMEPLECILDSGSETIMESEKDGPDAFTMRGRIGLIKGLRPDTRIGLGLGEGAISQAGIFLTRVRETYEEDGRHYVLIEKGMNMLRQAAPTGAGHGIVNFSKLGEKKTLLTHIVGPDHHEDGGICKSVALPPVDPGDVLLITNSGAYGPPTRRASKDPDPAPCHYLLARKMCSVKL